jgi:hypothetical protein
VIFYRKDDKVYHRWFAWYPVKLRGPNEWNRERHYGCGPRTVWLQYVWRKRNGRPLSTYYALFEDRIP